ncbi:MAG TPA: RNA polymerase sigma-G factor [Peptococcaceae bacterium]|nr:RNA polymerase sigma-G factor [Peptococcaceae bacterium]
MRNKVYLNLPNQPLLKEKEVRQLLRKAQQGDVRARETLINANLRLVCNVIKRFEGRGYDAEDLFQIGCIGLIKAIDKFDLRFKVKFSTYAVPMIIGEIKRFIRDDAPVHVARSLKELARKAQEARTRLQNQTGCEPTVNEIASELGVPAEELVAAMEAAQVPASLFDPLLQPDGDSYCIMDQVKMDAESEDRWAERISLAQLLSALPERDRQIIKWRFFEDKTQSEVASYLGLSQVQVSRLERRALQKLKTLAQGDA